MQMKSFFKCMPSLVAALTGAILLSFASAANAASLIATGEVRMCCATGGEDPAAFILEIRHANYSDGQPGFTNPTTQFSMFTFIDLESLSVGASKERTSGVKFDAAVEYLTNGVGYGPDSYDTINSIMPAPSGSRTSISNESYLFGLDSNDLAGYAIDKIEVVLTMIEIDRDYVFGSGVEGYRFDIRYDYNVYGAALVPVPGALLLFGSSLFGLLVARRRRKC